MPSRLVKSLLIPGALITATLAAAAPAYAVNPDQWIRWAGVPREATVRSLDFAGPLLYAASEDDGVFSSPTPVAGWHQSNDGLDSGAAQNVRQVKVAPNGFVYAATSAGLFRAAPGGGSFSQVGGGSGSHKLNMGGIQSIMFNGPTGTDISVAVAGAGASGVWNSSDMGNTWNRGDGMPDGENVFSLSSGPLQVPMYAATSDGVFSSPDFGRSWVLTSDGISPGESTLRVAVSPTDPSHLYASTSSSVYVSKNLGLTWSEAAGKDDAQLPAGGKRAFLLTPSLNGQFGEKHAIVGTDHGVWATIDDGDHWGQMSPDTITPDDSLPMKDRQVWSLGLGFTTPTIMAGTQGFGVFNLPILPITGGAPTISPTSSLNPGDTLTVPNDDPSTGKYMGFDGTRPFLFTYQWKKCTSNNSGSCSTISGATGKTYVIPTSDANTSVGYAVEISARNPVSPNALTKLSNITSIGVAPVPGSNPVPVNVNQLSFTQSPGQPYFGTTLTVNKGTWRTESNPALVTPTSYKYLWNRCDGNGANCKVLSGATGQTYKTTSADIGMKIQAFITATAAGIPSAPFLVDLSPTILNKFPVNTVAPKVVGNAYTGVKLSSSVGGWDGFDMTYERRWFRCESDGLGCNPINFPSQTGSTYTVTPADLGKRVALEVKAIAKDPNQNRVTTVMSAASAVITDPPPAVIDPVDVPNNGGQQGGGNGGGQQAGQQQGGGQQLPLSLTITAPKKLKAGASLSAPKTVAGYAKVKYQWLRNGKKIKKATKSKYKLTKADKGKKIACRITLTPAGGGQATVLTTAPVKVPKK